MKQTEQDGPIDPFAETLRAPADSSSRGSASSSGGGSSDDESAEDPRVYEAIKQYMAALESGTRPPSRQELIAKYPDIAAELSDALDGLAFVQSAAAKMLGPVVAPHDDPLDPSAHGGEGVSGKPLGDFQLVKEIGRGGMGVVYEAIQLSLGRRVAVKVLPMAAAFDERHLQRFRNEAQAAAQLHHTNIVPVYAVGCERGVHFYAMQLIEGQSLDAVIRELRYAAKAAVGASGAASTVATNGGANSADNGSTPPPVTLSKPPRPRPPHKGKSSGRSPVPILDYAVPSDSLTTLRSSKRLSFYQQVARLGLQAAEALEYAHRLGVVHRDVKPANLLLDVRGNLWVTDFGLAQLYEAEGNLTQTGDLLGTLRYMSPEQASGKAVVLDQRADIYSLGATLYELLTLERAVLGDTREQLLRELSTNDPRPPRSIDRAIPIELDTILMKATAKTPADRYPSSAALAEDLRRFLSDEPILARPPSAWDKTVKWTRRHKSVAVSALVVLVLALLGLGASTFLIAREQHKTKEAYVLERQRAKEANDQKARAEKSFKQAREVVDRYAKMANEMTDPRMGELRKRMMDLALVYYQNFLDERGDDPLLVTELAETKSNLVSMLSGLEAFDDLARALSRVRLTSEPSVRAELAFSDDQAKALDEIVKNANAALPGGPQIFIWRGGSDGGGPGGPGGGPGGPGGKFGGPPWERERSRNRDREPGPGPGGGGPGGGGPEQMSTDERNAQFAAKAAGLEAELRKVLTTAQVARLREIAWQVWGPMAFSDPYVVAELKLTIDQKDLVATTQNPFRDPWRFFGRGGGGPRGGRGGPRIDDENASLPDPKSAVKKIIESFTPEQANAWSRLTGTPFEGDVQFVNPGLALITGSGNGGFGRERGPGGPGGPGPRGFERFDHFEKLPDRPAPTTKPQ